MTTIAKALYEEAQRKILANFVLTDWQVEDAPDTPCAEPTRAVKVSATDTRLAISSATDRLVFWIEFHAGEMVLHAYDDGHETPVILRVSKDNITVEYEPIHAGDQSIDTNDRY